MTQIVASQSLDAEIYMDLKSGEVQFDYTLNQIANSYNSNRAVTIIDEFNEVPPWKRFVTIMKKIPIAFVMVSYNLMTAPLLAFLLKRGILKSKAWQVEHQKLLKWFHVDNFNMYEQIIECPIRTDFLKIWIPHNLWFEYHLEGEMRDHVTNISLTRHFDTTTRFGVYKQVKQDGWDVEFLFDKIPTEGRCILRHS